MCKSTVDLHKGSLSVISSGLGCGSTCSVTLPFVLRRCSNAGETLDSHMTHSTGMRGSYNSYVGDNTPFSTVTRLNPMSVSRLSRISDARICPTLSETASEGISAASGLSNQNNVESENRVVVPSSSISSGENYTLQRALIVDDVPINRRMLRRVLERSCGLIEEAEDGDEAVEKVKQSIADNTVYDMILMDYQMPNMDGPTAAQHMRELGYKGSIIGVTGNGLPADIEIFVRKGANRVLLKPVNAATISAAISTELYKRHGRL